MPAKKASKPQRTCVACRKSQDKSDLLRFVLAPDGQVVVDYRQHLPGRGVYTCPTRECLALAVKKNSFRRSFATPAAPVDVAGLQEQLRQALIQRIAGLVKMARKSGQLIAGSNQVLDALKRQSPALILVAQDITAAMGQKIESAAQRQNIYCIRMFDKESLGHMLGKEERSVVAVAGGPLATALLGELLRYELVREN
ncbi:MAG: DUF448 domain-containing protein [Pelovirga sp.]